MSEKKYYAFRRELEKDGNFRNSYTQQDYKAKRALLGLPILYQQPKPTITLNNSNGRKTSILHMSLKKYNSNYHLIYVFLPSLVGESNELNANGRTVKLFSKLNDIYSQFKNIW